MPQARGALSKLLFQKETAFRTLPSPVAAKVMPFTTYNVGRDPRRQADNSITSSPLPAKNDQGNAIVGGPFGSVLDLRSIGNWLLLLFGAPTTTGTGSYTHTFPINGNDRQSALLELGHSDISKFYRTLGAKLNKLSWNVLDNDQNISGEIIAAFETEEAAAFDAAPTSYDQFRACSAGGKVWDGAGSTLGSVVGGSVAINNNMKGYELADGDVTKPGYGLIDQGDLEFTGTLRAVFDGASAYALARANTSTRLALVSKATVGANTFTLTVDMPYVELIEKTVPKEGKSGLFVDLDWRAHAGATLPTVVLVNDVPSY